MQNPSALTIAHVETERGFSGGEVQVFLLMEGLRERGHRNILVCAADSEAHARATEAGYEVRPLRLRNSWDLPGVLALQRLLQRDPLDLAHLHTGRATWLGGLAARLAGVPALTTRRMDRRVRPGLRTRLIYSHLLERAAAISPAVEQHLLAGGVPPERISVIPSAAPAALDVSATRPGTRATLNAAPGTVVLLTLASLHRRKGVDVVLEALAALQTAVDWSLWIAGNGPEETALKAQTRALDLGARVRFLGKRSDRWELLAACDVFVLAARSEGLGVAALEAMAAARPVIATQVGGLGAAVVEGGTGLLVPPGDAPALAKALGRLLGEAELRDQLGRAGPARIAAGYLPEQMVTAYERLYSEILTRRAAA